MGLQGLRDDMDISTPIDVDLAIKGLDGDTNLFWRVLSNFEMNSLDSTMKDIVKSYDQKDHDSFHQPISNLLHTSGSIGASRIHCICFLISESHHN